MRMQLTWTCSKCGHENYYNTSVCFRLHRGGEFHITTYRLGEGDLVCKECGKSVTVSRHASGCHSSDSSGYLYIGGVA